MTERRDDGRSQRTSAAARWLGVTLSLVLIGALVAAGVTVRGDRAHRPASAELPRAYGQLAVLAGRAEPLLASVEAQLQGCRRDDCALDAAQAMINWAADVSQQLAVLAATQRSSSCRRMAKEAHLRVTDDLENLNFRVPSALSADQVIALRGKLRTVSARAQFSATTVVEECGRGMNLQRK